MSNDDTISEARKAELLSALVPFGQRKMFAICAGSDIVAMVEGAELRALLATHQPVEAIDKVGLFNTIDNLMFDIKVKATEAQNLIDDALTASEVRSQPVEAARRVLSGWQSKQGHDKCWYYPEIFRELCSILGVQPQEHAEVVPPDEFAAGCQRYHFDLYGKPIEKRRPDGSIEFFLGRLALSARAIEPLAPATSLSMQDSIEGIRRLITYERGQSQHNG